ncbi:MAG: hypothetical protein AAGG48_10430 [Planctomycetota bacterium]
MKFYKHEFPSVEDYLHHRPPYLLVDRIVSIAEDAIETERKVTGQEFFIAGHFPGAPIFPGAMMQELTTQSAGVLIAAQYNPMPKFDTHDPFFNEFALGVLVRVASAKYKGFARPGDTLNVRVQLDEHTESVFDFSAMIKVDGKTIMQNSFRLANVKSKVLQG